MKKPENDDDKFGAPVGLILLIAMIVVAFAVTVGIYWSGS